jgi:multidrug efflux pump subunit AcrB
MNQIVLIALRRPYTFVVLAILIVLFGTKSVLNTPTDVVPNIRIPVIAVVWSYTGLLPIDVSGRITFYFERALTSTVEGIQRIVSQSYYGISIINIFLQPETNLAGAEAEVAAIAQTVVKALPPDISPPMIMRLEASSVPVAMLQVTSDTLTPAELYNLSFTQIRPLLVTIPGAILPHPYGGKPMQLLVSLDQQKLLARHLTPEDIHKAFGRQDLVCLQATRRLRRRTGCSRRMRCRCRSRISTTSRSREKETPSSTCATSQMCNLPARHKRTPCWWTASRPSPSS